MLNTNQELTISEVLTLITENRFEQAKYLSYVWKLVFENKIKIDYENIKIDMNSLIRLNNE